MLLVAKVTVTPEAPDPLETDPLLTTSEDLQVQLRDIKDQFPVPVVEWLKREVFKGRTAIKVGDLKALIRGLPGDPKLWVSVDQWWGAQKVLKAKQAVVQLNIGPDMIAEIKADPLAYRFFTDFFKLTRNSGHPVNNQTVAWCRVYEGPDHWIVEEIQSDLFGASTKIRDIAHDRVIKLLEDYPEDQQRHLEKFFSQHFDEWDRKLLSIVIAMARDAGAKEVWILGEEFKRHQTGNSDRPKVSKFTRYYEQLPKEMGFKAATLHGIGEHANIRGWTRVVASFKPRVEARYRVRAS